MRRRTTRNTRRGAVAVLAALLMVPIMGLLAFTVDVGYIVREEARLQTAADAAALAAVVEFPDAAAVDAIAQEYASLNYPDADNILASSDIEPGIWDEDARTFTATGNYATANAVRITVRRGGSNGDPLNLFFAPVLGIDDADVQASAIAFGDKTLCGPLVGIESIRMAGTPTTDSYNSEEGPYDPLTAGDNGNICSDGWIDVIGAATVNGDANPGEGHETRVIGAAEVTGNTDPRTTPLDLPSVDASEAAEYNDNDQIPEPSGPGGVELPGGSPGPPVVDGNDNFFLTAGQTLDLPPGTYYFNNFTLTGQATINTSGPTTIYVTGDMNTAGGNMVNSSQTPSNLKLLMTEGTARILGNSEMYGVLYAPDTDVTITGTGDLFGSVVGRNLTMTGTGDAHYDESLDLSPEVDLPPTPVLVR